MVHSVLFRREIALAGALMLLAFTSACGKGSGSARLQFARSTATTALDQARTGSVAALATHTATSFKKKLIAAYLAEDVDPVTQNNIGNTSMFWLNSECSEDISNCNTFSPDRNGGTATHLITSLFDFTDPAGTNALLNSQGRSIAVGTYRYVRIEFCKYGAPEDNDASTGQHNIEWAYDDGSTTTTGKIAEDSCGVTSALASPIEVKDKDSVTVTLTYSLDGSISDSVGGSSANCSGSYCFSVPSFVPSASK